VFDLIVDATAIVLAIAAGGWCVDRFPDLFEAEGGEETRHD
jgi:hypothetical protein